MNVFVFLADIMTLPHLLRCLTSRDLRTATVLTTRTQRDFSCTTASSLVHVSTTFLFLFVTRNRTIWAVSQRANNISQSSNDDHSSLFRKIGVSFSEHARKRAPHGAAQDANPADDVEADGEALC